MNIKAYLKPHCGWSRGVRAIMEKYNLEYQDIDIINNPENYQEMVRESGQNLSPCVVINDVMLSDVSGEEVEKYLLENKLVMQSNKKIDVPINQPCTNQKNNSSLNKKKTIRFL